MSQEHEYFVRLKFLVKQCFNVAVQNFSTTKTCSHSNIVLSITLRLDFLVRAVKNAVCYPNRPQTHCHPKNVTIHYTQHARKIIFRSTDCYPENLANNIAVQAEVRPRQPLYSYPAIQNWSKGKGEYSPACFIVEKGRAGLQGQFAINYLMFLNPIRCEVFIKKRKYCSNTFSCQIND